MEKEKIKVSVIIDKEAVKQFAFSFAESPEEYREVEELIDKTNELVRDNTTETREKVVKAANSVFGRLALDIILCNNEDFVMSKRAEKPNEVSDKSGSVVVELTREQAKELVEKIESFTNKE